MRVADRRRGPRRPQSRVIFLLLAAPLGVRTIGLSARIAAPRMRLWQALWPLGAMPAGRARSCRREARRRAGRRAGADQPVLGRARRPADRAHAAPVGRRRGRALSRCGSTDDSSLASSFWSDYREDSRSLEDATAASLRHLQAHRSLSRPGLPGVPLLRHAPRTGAAEGMGRDRDVRAPRPVRAAAHARSALPCCRRCILWPFFGLSRRRAGAGVGADHGGRAARARPHGGLPGDGAPQGAHDLHPAARRHRHWRAPL